MPENKNMCNEELDQVSGGGVYDDVVFVKCPFCGDEFGMCDAHNVYGDRLEKVKKEGAICPVCKKMHPVLFMAKYGSKLLHTNSKESS